MAEADELDEIDALEAAGKQLMDDPAPVPPRKRETAAARRSPREPEQQAKGDAASVESLLAEIRDRLDRLLRASEQTRGNPPENPPPPAAEETDELRRAFPHEETDPPETPAAVATESASADTTAPALDATRLLATVEDRVTSHALAHHSSVVVLLGWAMALLTAGLGMGYGYIAASGRYPFWWPTAHADVLSRIAAAYLGAPVGVVLLPLAGAILWEASREAGGEKQQATMRLAAIVVFLTGVLLPITSVL
ncbi:MAG: hypothetical protein ACYDCX_10145 [Acidithiobacillus sp.]